MASTSGVYFAGGNIQWTISGLEYPSTSYSMMRIQTSDGKSKSWSDGTNYDNTLGHACGINVTGYGYATYNGVEYSAGTSSPVFTENCADTTPPTLATSFGPSSNSIFISWNTSDSDFYSCTFAIGNSSGGPFRTFVTSFARNASTTVSTDYYNNNLVPSTTYYFNYSVRDQTGNVRYYPVVSVATTSNASPPVAPTFFQYSKNASPARTYTISWTGSTGATSYRLEARKGFDAFSVKYTGSATSCVVTYDLDSTQYENRIYALNQYGSSPSLVGYITTDGGVLPNPGTPVTPPPIGGSPGAPGEASGLSIFRENPNSAYMDYYVSFNGSGAANYRILVRKTSDTLWYQKYNGVWANPLIRFDEPRTSYEVRVYACNSGTNDNSCSIPVSATFTTDALPDTVPPTVSQTYQSHGISIDANWSITDVTNNSATDTESGFKNAFLFMSGANVTSPRNQMFQTLAAQGSFNLTVDGTGVAIKSQTNYTFHWEAYDNAGNKATTAAITVTTTVERPPNFFWNPPISAGANYNMTANQWRFFQDQVNAFRGYKSMAAYSFSTVVAGTQPTANHYNEARNAIYPMNGNIPPFRSAGETLYASDYNSLATALNAVT